MPDKTKIEWADATWNPVTGCSPISEGCENCYARRMATRLEGRSGYPKGEPFRVTNHPTRYRQLLDWRKPRRIFVCSMGDLFHSTLEEARIHQVLRAMCDVKRHTYMVLTKRPARMRSLVCRFWKDSSQPHKIGDYAPLAPADHIHFGVTTENQLCADRRIEPLLHTPAAVRFVSSEPLLGPINLTPWVRYLDWVICGAETGPRARPMDPDWARYLLRQCREAGVPFFMKQMSKKQPIPKDLMVREFPLSQS